MTSSTDCGVIGSFDLEKPVAKEQHYVTRAQLAGRTVIFCVIKDPELADQLRKAIHQTLNEDMVRTGDLAQAIVGRLKRLGI